MLFGTYELYPFNCVFLCVFCWNHSSTSLYVMLGSSFLTSLNVFLIEPKPPSSKYILLMVVAFVSVSVLLFNFIYFSSRQLSCQGQLRCQSVTRRRKLAVCLRTRVKKYSVVVQQVDFEKQLQHFTWSTCGLMLAFISAIFSSLSMTILLTKKTIYLLKKQLQSVHKGIILSI